MFFRSAPAVLAAVVLGYPACAVADTLVGLQGIVLSGHHFEPGNDVQGSGAGGFIEITQRWKNVHVHLEGIPVVDTARAASDRYGAITQSFGLFNGVVSVPLERRRHLWAGIGTGLVAQRTPQFNYPFVGRNQVNSSRLAGTRYELSGNWRSQKNATFFEASIDDQPHMRGPDFLNVSVAGVAFERSKGEEARMLDTSTAFGIVRGHVEYAVGLRWVNFSSNFTDGDAADRNVGIGPTFEVRYIL
ncbi:MAG TPA: hypothetical protein VJN22_01495 [Candidatus Eremiobacteraceae bacterium]|nr:hypothetical protein [Candidatus Eremiobacteraceae bacterium]